MKLPCPTEAQEAKTLVAYLRIKGLKFTHIANETGGTPEALRRAIRVKREGTSKGTPDYMIIVNGSLLFVELKRLRGSNISSEQLEWVEALNKVNNVEAIIAHGAQVAVDVIESLNNTSRPTAISMSNNPLTF